jgi:hypothetical protein
VPAPFRKKWLEILRVLQAAARPDDVEQLAAERASDKPGHVGGVDSLPAVAFGLRRRLRIQ